MPTVAIIGGTGPEGRGLALRFALAGYPVVIGSRDRGRAEAAASGLLEARPGLDISGAVNADAAGKADWVLLALPFEGVEGTTAALAPALAGKLVVSVVAPLVLAAGQFKPIDVPQGSAAQLVRGLLPDSRVASAFQNLSARDLLAPDRVLEGDVAVCSDDEEARRQTMELARSVKDLRAIDAGPLSNSRYVESLTGLLLNLNRLHKAHTTVRIVGL